MTSQIPVEHWHELIADPTIADAVLDRLVHTFHRLELDGPSLRDPKTGSRAAAPALLKRYRLYQRVKAAVALPPGPERVAALQGAKIEPGKKH